ncbi:MAG: hypothetical protein GY795_51450 [Desulfobacterales bacterium]|nr:hypothetical protein [Desulfobacterales bacterium]
MLNEELIHKLRCFAKNNSSVTEMARYLIQASDLGKESRLIVTAYFREAFCLELKDISQLGAWNFFEGGTWSDEKIESEIRPIIMGSSYGRPDRAVSDLN